jgi:4-hydroxy-tetrahydrodipicolinate reductase
MNPLRITVAGASGRMGRTLIRALAEAEDVQLAFALERSGHPEIGNDAGAIAGLPPLRVQISDDRLTALASSDAVLDFTAPDASVALAELAAKACIVHVIGTTGYSPDHQARVKAAARNAVIIKSGNMSLGMNMLAALVRQAAKALPNYDIEIVEMHHRMKVDAPSGTALMLGQAVAAGRGVSLEEHEVSGRGGNKGARRDGEIGFSSLRGGTVVGDHLVVLAGPFERIELGHRAEDRMIFARGALAAARWGYGKNPGLYSMTDVLGLSE